MLLSGYSVVMLPQFNYSKDSSIELLTKAPTINGIYYEGYQRKPLGNLFELSPNGVLPEDIAKIYSHIREFRNQGLYDYYVTNSYIDANQVKNYSNSLGDNLEVIGVYSKELEKYLGVSNFDGRATFLGYDINADGYSLILTSFFEQSNLFANEIYMMNKYGLLQDVKSVDILINKYISLQNEENLEIVFREKLDVVSIYRMTE